MNSNNLFINLFIFINGFILIHITLKQRVGLPSWISVAEFESNMSTIEVETKLYTEMK